MSPDHRKTRLGFNRKTKTASRQKSPASPKDRAHRDPIAHESAPPARVLAGRETDEAPDIDDFFPESCVQPGVVR